MTPSSLWLDDDRDNCGFGLIAHRQGEASHALLAKAIAALTHMTHRGGIAADGKTGDGCGLLIHKPDAFFRAEARKLFDDELPDRYAVGMVFLFARDQAAEAARTAVSEALTEQQLCVHGWREVPIDPACCGPVALASLPRICQVFVSPNADTEQEGELSPRRFAARLYVARRKAERVLTDDPDFYICSLSEQAVVYKGLFMPADLPHFYHDLGNPEVATSVAVFHQRFSTNTAPRWPLAQPFRLLAHNGEINTIAGNRNWARARARTFQSPSLPALEDLQPVVNTAGSDSSSLDDMLELMLLGGMDIFRAARTAIPPAWQNFETMDSRLRAFYEFNSMHMEPWDGPAGIVLTDGRFAACLMDRNGLRPVRWMMTRDNLITLASETGVMEVAPEDVVAKGQVGPGHIVAVDTQTGEFLQTQAIDDRLKRQNPYKQWLKDHAVRLQSRLDLAEQADGYAIQGQTLSAYMKLFQVTREECDTVIAALAEQAQEAVASMGDDTPMAVLSRRIRPLTDYFRQQFAQVTNPSIDSLREACVMSLESCLGPERNLFMPSAEHAKRLILTSPVLSPLKFQNLLHREEPEYKHALIDVTHPADEPLADALDRLAGEAEAAVRDGAVILVLSDRSVAPERRVAHIVMATGAVHHRLVDRGLRTHANIVLDTGALRDSHQFAVAIGFGATAVYPYLAYEVIDSLVREGRLSGHPHELSRNYRKGIDKGLFKIMSKMGISTLASYRGAQLFEAVGLGEEVVARCFPGVTSRIGGARFEHFEAEQTRLVKQAWTARIPLQQGGHLKYVHDEEYHAYNPDVVMTLRQAVQQGDAVLYRDYAALVNQRPVATLRDLLGLQSDREPIALNQVEPAKALFARFDTAAMSLGALSPEAHEALAVAMNELGGYSNSGEGGEDPNRFQTPRNSRIKQVASGRFGVTPHYLVNADVLQIKIAQGAKPGEGGQLPGGKVNALIARLRFSVPGVTLISPPPHHDIYSIEDLAQLIFDLKQVNPTALVSVKLVSEPGVGTIAAGVVKAYADLITVSGYDGGTGASPVTSIKHAGSPWELGLAEVHQSLRGNNLRDRVRLQTDGGLKTGLDVVKAALLGAESFGFGTAPMVALGCKYLRLCHLNNCATGVATQDELLRQQHFQGTVAMVKHYFHCVAEEIREILASLGYRTLEEIVGRADLLTQLLGETDRQSALDLSPLYQPDDCDRGHPHTCQVVRNEPHDRAETAEHILQTVMPALESGRGGRFQFALRNSDRAIGARISGEIARRFGADGLPGDPLELSFKGVAGQSFGAWNAPGLEMTLDGDANDYVGKGMAGGKLVVRPPAGSLFKSQETAIMGNTCLYGATGGKLFAAGRAGQRFAVRNSGCHAVVEGAGDHCCEYMTGGMVAVLGSVGSNFGAGMTGGFAYVLDLENSFQDKFNRELVDVVRVHPESMEEYRQHLQGVIGDYVAQTQSDWGADLLEDFDDYVRAFWLVKPKAANLSRLLSYTRARPE